MSESLGRFRVHHLQGNSGQQGLYKGPVGEITVDTELQALRIQDGVLRGGHPTIALADAIAQFTPTIIASDGGVDWYGELSSNHFIGRDELIGNLNLTVGTPTTYDTVWLNVKLDGVRLLIAKRPLLHFITWGELNTNNLITGNRTVNINGKTYKVRLFKALNPGVNTASNGFDVSLSANSEWNRIMYRLTQNVYLDSRNRKTSIGAFTHLHQYSEEDLILDHRFGDGSASWCQETLTYRGYAGVSNLYKMPSDNALAWRPVLEEVS